ncbi:MAG: hypothetical protein KDB07_12885 [Planctomycetes bacterium]|nr:hypothetical protein [Planctomycetota bacterium]
MRVLLSGLNNPSGIAFSSSGQLAVCEAGAGDSSGRVHIMDLEGRDVLAGFPTEYWKVDADTGAKSYKVGPLSAVYLNNDTLLVTNAGLADGDETILTMDLNGQASASNSAAYVSDNDHGEGNLTGMALSSDGSVAYVCGQGSDAKTWVLRYDVAKNELARAFSADDHGIAVNSPMQCRLVNDETLLVLYSGIGAVANGAIVQWNVRTGLPDAQWTLPNLVDPMGMDFIPGSKNELVVVDNNWQLNTVNPGALARVTLGEAGEATVTMLDAPTLMGPVSCTFGPDGMLYVTELGANIDKAEGRLVILGGIK